MASVVTLAAHHRLTGQVPSDDRDLERTEASLRAADSHLAQALRFLAEAATEIDLAGQEVAHLPFGPTNDDLAVATAFVDLI